MTHLTIGDETFEVDVVGDATKPAVLLSNSLGTDLSMWDGQVAALAKHFRVIRYDPRGHGGSVVGDAPASIDRLGTDVLGILDALEIDKAHFIGLSMGGAVGIWLLVNAPYRIGRAVLANTAARFGAPETWNARITSVLDDGMNQNAAATMERWFSADFSAREAARVEKIHAMLRNVSPSGYAQACAALRDMDLRVMLDTIETEVLVVTGRHDPVVPDDDAKALVEGIAGAEQVALDARHMSNIEAEADFNAAVVAFLTRPARKAPAKAKPGARKKPAPRKTSPMKRGGAGRRSNAARSPLKKTPAKRPTAKKAAKTPAAAHRRPAKTSKTHRAAAKTTTKRPAKKTAARKTAARRPTPTGAARASKARASTARASTARASPAKKATKKATKTAAKKSAAKTTTKKLPTARRKRAAKPRRPTGRRKT